MCKQTEALALAFAFSLAHRDLSAQRFAKQPLFPFLSSAEQGSCKVKAAKPQLLVKLPRNLLYLE